MKAEVVDLFCGVGGLSAGFKNEGFVVRAGFDLDACCAYPYETNIGARFQAVDVASLDASKVRSLYSGRAHRILVGCAPCQPFSIYTGRYRDTSGHPDMDGRWQLLQEFARLVEDVRPDVVSMENVPRVVLHPVFATFTRRLREAGYSTTQYKVRAEHYGVPQRRARLVLFASRHGPIEMEPATHRTRPRSVRDAIGRLPAIKAGDADPDDPLHASRGLSERNLARIRATPEGGSWKDWDQDLRLPCHGRAGGETFRSVYGRMRWDEPSPVITTQCLGIGNGRFGHPEQDRAISIREASLLQSFPSDYRWTRPGEPVNGMRLARQIGNAVPVKLAGAVARSVRTHLDQVDARSG